MKYLKITLVTILVLLGARSDAQNKVVLFDQSYNVNFRYIPVDSIQNQRITEFELAEANEYMKYVFQSQSLEKDSITLKLYSKSLNSNTTKLEKELQLSDEPSFSVSLNHDKKYFIQFYSPRSCKNKLDFHIESSFKTFDNKDYNSTNRIYNAQELTVDGDTLISDLLNGTIKLDGKYSKWYKVKFNKDIDFIFASITKNLDFQVYKYRDGKLTELNSTKKQDNNISELFLELKGESYFFRVSSSIFLNEKYEFELRTGTHKFKNKNNLEYSYIIENINSKKDKISPGDTVKVELSINNYIPVRNNWLHSLIEKLNGQAISLNEGSIDNHFINLDSIVSTNYGGKFDGSGDYYESNNIGPKGNLPLNYWGQRPNVFELATAIMKKDLMLVIDKNFPCDIDTMVYSIKVNSDSYTGNYKDTNFISTLLNIKIPINCCENKNKSFHKNVCIGSTETIDVLDENYVLQNSFDFVTSVFDKKSYEVDVFKNSNKDQVNFTFINSELDCPDTIEFNFQPIIHRNANLSIIKEDCKLNTLEAFIDPELSDESDLFVWNKNETNNDYYFMTMGGKQTKVNCTILDKYNCKHDYSIVHQSECEKIRISLSPNPSHGNFEVGLTILDETLQGDVTYIITNENGQYKNKGFLYTGQNIFNTNLPTGTYSFIVLINNEQQLTKKFIITR